MASLTSDVISPSPFFSSDFSTGEVAREGVSRDTPLERYLSTSSSSVGITFDPTRAQLALTSSGFAWEADHDDARYPPRPMRLRSVSSWNYAARLQLSVLQGGIA